MYAKGFLHHGSQMGIGAMTLVIGGFHVQSATLDLDFIIWFKVINIALFAFLSQYGWLLFYRLDDYVWDKRIKNRSILIAKSPLSSILYEL
jgi:hypothetical protein